LHPHVFSHDRRRKILIFSCLTTSEKKHVTKIFRNVAKIYTEISFRSLRTFCEILYIPVDELSIFFANFFCVKKNNFTPKILHQYLTAMENLVGNYVNYLECQHKSFFGKNRVSFPFFWCPFFYRSASRRKISFSFRKSSRRGSTPRFGGGGLVKPPFL